MNNNFTWEDVSISQFEQIVSISGMKKSYFEKAIEILSVMTGETSEHYRNMFVEHLRGHIARISTLKAAELKPRLNGGRYTIDDIVYKLTTNADRMTAGQFIDYQLTMENDPGNIAMLCAILLVPKGGGYGEGYDVLDLAKKIHEKFPYIDAMGISFFLQKTFDALSAATLYSSIRKMKREMKKEKDPQRKQIIQKAIERTQREAEKIQRKSGTA